MSVFASSQRTPVTVPRPLTTTRSIRDADSWYAGRLTAATGASPSGVATIARTCSPLPGRVHLTTSCFNAGALVRGTCEKPVSGFASTSIQQQTPPVAGGR